MELIAHLERLFAYDAWANRETLASLEAARRPPGRAMARMAHVLGAEWLWLARLRGEGKSMAAWPDLTFSACCREAGRLESIWRAHLAGLTDEALSRSVRYVNNKGEPWESTAGDILIHVTMHSAYHRGQIASDLREAGFEPAYTDFIHAVRQGLVE
jgi:uncharacterized damage-inducible protein DinB